MVEEYSVCFDFISGDDLLAVMNRIHTEKLIRGQVTDFIFLPPVQRSSDPFIDKGYIGFRYKR